MYVFGFRVWAAPNVEDYPATSPTKQLLKEPSSLYHVWNFRRKTLLISPFQLTWKLLSSPLFLPPGPEKGRLPSPLLPIHMITGTSFITSSPHQPTKNLTKGGVLRKRKTSSLVRLVHSCVRNSLQDMVNGALKQNGGVLTLTGFLSRRKALTFSN
jgi:hypothetical protein